MEPNHFNNHMQHSEPVSNLNNPDEEMEVHDETVNNDAQSESTDSDEGEKRGIKRRRTSFQEFGYLRSLMSDFQALEAEHKQLLEFCSQGGTNTHLGRYNQILEQDIQKLSEDYEKLKKEYDDLKSGNTETISAKDYETLKILYSSLKVSEEELTIQNQRLEKANLALKNDNDKLLEELKLSSTGNQNTSALQLEIEQLQGTIHKLQNENLELQKNNYGLQSTLESLKTMVSNFEQEKLQLSQNQLNQKPQMVGEYLQLLNFDETRQDVKDIKKAIVSRVQEECETIKKELNSSREKLTEVKLQLIDLKMEKKQLQFEIEVCKYNSRHSQDSKPLQDSKHLYSHPNDWESIAKLMN